jgi:hypothetical protein
MLTIIVACSLGCGFKLLVSFCKLLLFNIFLELLYEKSHIFIITFGAIFFFLFFLLLVLALLVCLESNLFLPCGSDAFGEVLDMIGFFDVHLMVHDPTKHIIG